MKKLWILFFLVFICLNAKAQGYDTVIKKDGSTVQGKLLKVTDSTIEFDPKGDIPFIIINRSDVESILYSNGTLVKFSQSSNNSINNYQDNIAPDKPKMKFVDSNGQTINNIDFTPYETNLPSTSYMNLNKNFIQKVYSSVDNSEYNLALGIQAQVVLVPAPILHMRKPIKVMFTNVLFRMALFSSNNELLKGQEFPEHDFFIEITKSDLGGVIRELNKDLIQVPEYANENCSFEYNGITFKALFRVAYATYFMSTSSADFDIFASNKFQYD